MNIVQVTSTAKPSTTERGQRFITKVLGYSMLLRTLMNFKIKATQHQYRPAAGSQTLAGRTTGNNYSGADLSPAALQAGELSLHGFYLKYDQTYMADHNLGIGIGMDQWLEDELDDRAYDTALEIDKLIIASDGSSNTMEGIATILDGSANVPGLGITMVIDALTGSGITGEDSFDLSASANYNTALEQVDKWKGEVMGANALICNESAKARFTTIAREKHALTWSKDEFGNPIEVVNGLKIIAVDDSVITKAEPDNAGTPVNETTSIYIINNSEGLWNINTNSGLAFYDYGELPGEQQEGMSFEFRAKNEIKRKRAIRRVRNIKL